MSSKTDQKDNSNNKYHIINNDSKTSTKDTSATNSPPDSRQHRDIVSKSSSPSSHPHGKIVGAPGSTTTLRTKDSEPPAFEKGIASEISANFGQMVQIIFIKPLRIKIAVE